MGCFAAVAGERRRGSERSRQTDDSRVDGWWISVPGANVAVNVA